jgi:hypothetical protein
MAWIQNFSPQKPKTILLSTAVRMRVYSAIFGFDGTPGDAEAAAAHW